MLTPVPPDQRSRLRPLFEDFPGLHGVIDSILEGVLGQAWADPSADPQVTHLELDFHLIAGKAGALASATVGALPAGAHVVAPESLVDSLIDARDQVQAYDRIDFDEPPQWDRARLAGLRDSLPAGFTLERITGETVSAFEALADSLVYNFDSHEHFLTRGVGFGVRHQGRFVSGCSSFAISSRSLEFDIQTDERFQRRGLATAVGARMIEHCLDNGLTPCWDAAHEGSALLAERLGFGKRRPYTAYRLE